MTLVKKFLSRAVLALMFVLTASAGMFCIVVDNDGDGDPTTGLTIEFTLLPCKKSPGVTKLQMQSTVGPKMCRVAPFRRPSFERSGELRASSDSFNLVELASPLRC
jgi:hypothetical protein